MLAYILYSKDSPMEHAVAQLASRLAEFRVEAKVVDADSMEGIALSQNYDLMSRPAVVLVRGDGSLVERWLGDLPMAEDISYLAHQ